MSPFRFALLLAATVVAVGLAGWAIATRQVPAAGRTVDEPLVAGLLDRLDDIATIRFRRGETVATVRRDGDVWRVEELRGYPADTARIRDLALGLANLRLVETKTAQADRLDRLDLGDPATAPADGAREITLEDASGAVLASVVLGRERPKLFGSAGSGIYVRRAGEDQAWLAAGELTVPDGPLKFAQVPILDVGEGEVARVTLDVAGPDPVVVLKHAPLDETFALEGVSPGMQADNERLGRLAATLDMLQVQDVMPAADRPLGPETRAVRFETWDGLVVTVTTDRPLNGPLPETWARFSVATGPKLGDAPEIDPGAPDAAERARTLQARLEPWVFRLTGTVGTRLGWGRDDLQMPLAPSGGGS
ncbi:MAG: DUF4340 domain-containing protein [Geminicoccaceae bacterium]